MNTEMVFICAAFGACILALAGTTLYRLYRIERKRINYLFELAEERKYVHEERLNSERLQRAVAQLQGEIEETRNGGKGLNGYWLKQLQVQNAQLQADVEDAHNSVNAHSARMWEEKFRSEESKADLYYSRVKIQERVVADLEREVKELRSDLLAAQSQSAEAENGGTIGPEHLQINDYEEIIEMTFMPPRGIAITPYDFNHISTKLTPAKVCFILNALASWFDNPNVSPTLIINAAGKYTAGQLLRSLQWHLEQTVTHSNGEDTVPPDAKESLPNR